MEYTNTQLMRGVLFDKLKEEMETTYAPYYLIMGKSIDENHGTSSYLVQIPALPSKVVPQPPTEKREIIKDSNHYLGMVYTSWTKDNEALAVMIRLFEGEHIAFTPPMIETIDRAFASLKLFGTLQYNKRYKTFIYSAIYPIAMIRNNENLFVNEDGIGCVLDNALHEIDTITTYWREKIKPTFICPDTSNH